MAATGNTSNFVGHEPCPKCGSRDNLARYDDGHGYCFGCGYHEQGAGTGQGRTAKRGGAMFDKASLIEGAEIRALPKRGITEETCRKFRYEVGKDRNGKTVQIANYIKDGKVVAQKLRYPNKEFKFIGNPKEVGLYGQHLWRDGGKRIVVTEGEIDALSVSQVQGNKWPVVSVPNGAQGAAKAVAKEIEFLEGFEQVVFAFDMDEPGQEAAKECAALLTPGKAFIAHLPMKDANECLKAGKSKELVAALWDAKAYRPDGLIWIDDIIEEAKKPVEWGAPWAWETLTKLTYGRRLGEIYALGAGTGVGKTDVFTQQIAFDVEQLGMTVGVIYLEQMPTETAKRIAGKLAGRVFHVPDAGWTQEELDAALEKLRGKVVMYDSFGETEWDVVKGKIRYMATALGIKHIYLDHLTAMADTSKEKESIEQMMKEMAGLANKLKIVIHFVSHLSTPEGKPHEEGGRVMIRHFKGSRSIGFWSYFMFGLERNQQAEDPEEKRTTTFRVLKDRYTGRSTGEVFGLRYDHNTGMLTECELKRDSDPSFAPVGVEDDDDCPF